MALFPKLTPDIPTPIAIELDLSKAKPTPADPNVLMKKIFKGEQKVTYDDLNKVIDVINQLHVRLLALEPKK